MTTSRTSFAPYLYDDAFAAPPVELAVVDAFPWPEVELAVRNREHDLMAEQHALEVCVASSVMSRSSYAPWSPSPSKSAKLFIFFSPADATFWSRIPIY